MGFLDGLFGGGSKVASSVGESATKGASSVGASASTWTSGAGAQAIAMVAGMIVDYAFASSIKKDQKKFEKEISKLSAEKQQQLLLKVQQVSNELERQKIVYQYIDKAKIEDLKNETKKERIYLYSALGLGVVLYGLVILKLKKR